MKAPFMYISRFWIAPQGREQLFAWLDGGHVAEVVSQPGFLFAHRIKLDQRGDDGWESYQMLYGLASRQALETYFANTALHDKFTRERASFAQYLRMDRAWGSLDSSIER